LWQGEIDAHPTRLLHIKRTKDLERAKEEAKLGLIFGFQRTECMGRDLTLLDVFCRLGVRIIQLTYNTANFLGVGCLEPRDGGLTKLGKEAVAELNELGVAIDLSHCGPQTTADGIAYSEKPIVISHSGCSEVYSNPRSKDDKLLRAMADKGGVIGIYLMPFLGYDGTPYPNLEMLLDHIDHAIHICGVEHVGIGSDLSITPIEESPEYLKALEEDDAERARLGIQAPDEAGRPPYMPEANTPRRIETVALAMSRRKHSEDVIEKVIGGNFQRVFSEIWKA
jgi:membrane dipeptidase